MLPNWGVFENPPVGGGWGPHLLEAPQVSLPSPCWGKDVSPKTAQGSAPPLPVTSALCPHPLVRSGGQHSAHSGMVGKGRSDRLETSRFQLKSARLGHPLATSCTLVKAHAASQEEPGSWCLAGENPSPLHPAPKLLTVREGAATLMSHEGVFCQASAAILSLKNTPLPGRSL